MYFIDALIPNKLNFTEPQIRRLREQAAKVDVTPTKQTPGMKLWSPKPTFVVVAADLEDLWFTSSSESGPGPVKQIKMVAIDTRTKMIKFNEGNHVYF